MGALRVLVAKKVPKVWEKLGLRKYLILGMYLVGSIWTLREYPVIEGIAQE